MHVVVNVDFLIETKYDLVSTSHGLGLMSRIIGCAHLRNVQTLVA